MKTAIAKRWVEALRSGKYKQGKEYLKRGNKYCCLGVLCDLYLTDKKKEWRVNNEGTEPFYTCEKSEGALPTKVMKWAKMPDDTSVSDQVAMHHMEERDKYDEVITLVEANDTRGYNFEQIAKLIETEFLTDNE